MVSKKKKWYLVPNLIPITICERSPSAVLNSPDDEKSPEGWWESFDELFHARNGKGKERTKKTIRDKYVVSIRNTANGKMIHMNRKLRHLIHSDHDKRKLLHLPGPKPAPGHRDIKRFVKSLKRETNNHVGASVQETHPLALNGDNAPHYYLDDDLISQLLNIQNRDLSPEDYDLLLQLDSFVSAKTLSLSNLNRLSIGEVSEEEADESLKRETNNHVEASVEETHPLALNGDNAPHYYSDDDLITQLLNIQNRDLSPEDYDLLLQLDSFVFAKTLSLSNLNRLSIGEVSEEEADEVCCICFEPLEIGQHKRCLPCRHRFHASCIDRWLLHESQNCPLDGKAVHS